MGETNQNWDVIIIGGALAGSATALMLARRHPQRRILILERSEKLGRRVGESTVEISAFFLSRVLGLNEHLVEHHLPKQGLRFWFQNDRARALNECSETGPIYNVRLPAFQIDRAVLDEHVLEQATSAGVDLQRGVRVRSVHRDEGALQTVAWTDAAGTDQTTTTRWVVDASGQAALLARQEGWLRPNHEHPIASCWTRWSGVTSLDDRDLAARYPAWAQRVKGQRAAATNHLTGYGWWAWVIPLKGGDYSIGVVYDHRIIELPDGPNLGHRLRTMLETHPVGRELLSNATWQEGDVHFRRNLAYSCSTVATDGTVQVGDAAGFIDPFYSPGLDWLSFSVTAAVMLMETSFRGRSVAEQVARHNTNFAISYERTFRALYLDKYYYIGEFDLLNLGFRLDLGLYYLGVVSLPFARGGRTLETPPFSHPNAKWPFRIMALYSRRLAAMAIERKRRGTWGRHNDRRFSGFISYEFNLRLKLRVLGLLGQWIALELREGWRSWFARAPADVVLDYKKANR